MRMGQRSSRLALVVVLATAASVAAWLTTPRRGASRTAAVPGGGLVLALGGDVAMSAPLDLRSPGVRSVAALLRRSSVALVNFELSAPAAPEAQAADRPQWPRATPEAAAQLGALGVGAVSLANNHAVDFGPAGLEAVQGQLEAAGLVHAGAGVNLDAARAPAYVVTRDGTVAVISVALSHAAGARATPAQGDINGRPGVNGLRFTRRLTVDAAAFAALAEAFPPAMLTPRGAAWDLFGLTVVRGDRGGMDLVADPDDLAAVVSAVREARGRAAAVVVSVHAHEPGNRVDDPLDLFRTVAHTAIDAGADVVHGHGPHRLRGVELYEGRPVFYSLGNLVFPDRDIRPEAADEFEDHGRNVLSPFTPEVPADVGYDEDAWWHGAIGMVQLTGAGVRRVELHPIDLGVGQPRETRGLPALAAPALGAAILERLRALSAPLGATIRIENGVGVVSGPS